MFFHLAVVKISMLKLSMTLKIPIFAAKDMHKQIHNTVAIFLAKSSISRPQRILQQEYFHFNQEIMGHLGHIVDVCSFCNQSIDYGRMSLSGSFMERRSSILKHFWKEY